MTILLLEPDIRLVKALSARMEGRAIVLGPADLHEAVELAERGKLVAALGEAVHLEDLGRFAAKGVPCGLWTSRSVDDLVAPARAAGISLLASKTHPLLLDELLMAFDGWAKGFGPGIGKYLGPDGKSLGSLDVSTPSEVAEACRRVLSVVPGSLGSSRRLKLVLDELMTNTLHHGGGVAAKVEWGGDDTRHVFLVRDSAGRLKPDEALRLLDRHLHGEGLQDLRGRGLHLSRTYADRLYVTVVPGHLTESAAVFWNHPGAFQGFKPIWVQSVRHKMEV